MLELLGRVEPLGLQERQALLLRRSTQFLEPLFLLKVLQAERAALSELF
jgi:hypothetical protein